MKKQFTNIKGQALNNFTQSVKGDDKFQLVLKELIKNNKISTEDITILDAKKLESTDGDVEYLVASLENDKVRITFIKTEKQNTIGLRILEEENGVTVAKMYQVIDGSIQSKGDVNYENILEAVKQLEQSELPEELDRKEVIANLPCLYGNWCGPGCSGPSAPISPVDSCCKSHDNCYGSVGYFACSCDNKLLNCLWPYVLQGSEWAILIYSYFANSVCNPFL